MRVLERQKNGEFFRGVVRLLGQDRDVFPSTRYYLFPYETTKQRLLAFSR